MNLFTLFGHCNWNILIASRVVLLVAVSFVFVWKVTNIDTHLHLESGLFMSLMVLVMAWVSA